MSYDDTLWHTDSYKFSQYNQYPRDTTHISSYIEARGGAPETMFFGLQMFLKEYLSKPIDKTHVEEMVDTVSAHGEPINKEGIEYVLNKHGGYWPVEVSAVAEGTVMTTNNVQVQVVNTDERTPWVTSLLETDLLRAVWYPSTVATRSLLLKRIIKEALERSSDIPWEEQIGFKLHDFGA